jgi:hypothetical protein
LKGKYLGLMPIAVLLLGLLLVISTYYPEQNLPRNLVFELPSPFSSAHSIFLSVSVLVVAYFFGRGFLSSGLFNLVALGDASLILGSGFLLSQILGTAPFGGPNELTGISSVVFLLSGILFAASATLNLLGRDHRLARRKAALFGTYMAGIVLVVAAILIVETHSLPAFFIRGTGPTLFREELLGGATILYAYSSVVLMRNHLMSHESVLYWFSLGLTSITVGFLSAFLGKVPGGPFSWLGRIAVAVGGIYLLVAIKAAFKRDEAQEIVRAESSTV